MKNASISTMMVAVGMIVGTSLAFASGEGEPEDEDMIALKRAACEGLGCMNGPRDCAHTTVTLQHPVYGALRVEIWCREP
jgi:hypothetical protein